MLLDADDCQLVLIDYQARLMPAINDAAAVVANARRLAQIDKASGGKTIWRSAESAQKPVT